MSNVFTASVNNQKQFILPVTNLLPKNSLGGALANSTTAQGWGIIIIPDAIKNNNYDYISFSALSSSSAGDESVCVVNIEYLLPAEMANTISVLPDGTDIPLTGGRYKVEIRPPNGMLLPIDIKVYTLYLYQLLAIVLMLPLQILLYGKHSSLVMLIIAKHFKR